jgi:hypothetical protein
MKLDTTPLQRRIAMLVGLLVFWLPSFAGAQPDFPPMDQPPPLDDEMGPMPPGMEEPGTPEEQAARRQRMQERLRVMRAWRLTEAIEMDEVTAVQLFELLDHYDELVAGEQQQLDEVTAALRLNLEGGGGTDEEITTQVESIMQIHMDIEQLRVDLVRDSAVFLNARQRAALMVFLPEFDADVRNMIREVRQQRREMRQDGGDRGDRQRRRHGDADTEDDASTPPTEVPATTTP